MQTKVIIKYLLSFIRKNWNIENYPIEIYINKNAGEKNVMYGARVMNWPIMVGHGKSKEAAFESLKNHFILFKQNNELPRPGVIVPIKFESTKKIDEFEDIAEDFFKIILNINYHDGFYSDGSSLELLVEEKSKEILIQKVRDVYNVDISNLYDEPLWKVFQALSNKKLSF